MMKDKKVFIVGSGTSGLISALMLKSVLPQLDCTIIHNPKKGIIGVGEGTTEHLLNFMQVCKIDRVEFLVKTNGVPKKGVYFKNWLRDDRVEDYMHYLTDDDMGGIRHGDGTAVGSGEDFKPFPMRLAANIIKDNKNLKKKYVLPNLGYHYGQDPVTKKPFEKDVIFLQTYNQFHFDSLKVYEYLSLKCKDIGITFIEDNVIDVERGERGVTSLIGEKKKYEVDFIIDCSGFDRSILKRHYGIKWNDLNDYLPCNSALVTMTQERSNELFPFTLAEGMEEGWLWRAPTRTRYGNGYVFNRDFSNIDKISKEFSQRLGIHEQEFRQIPFDPGYLECCMVDNVFATGMSAAFFEPIEASSIGYTIKNMEYLINHLPDYFNGFNISNTINTFFDKMLKNIYFFIKFHYITKVKDLKNDWWKRIYSLKRFDWEDEILEKWNTRMPSSYIDDELFHFPLYHSTNFLQIGLGNHYWTKDQLKKMFDEWDIEISVEKMRQDDGQKVNQDTIVCENIEDHYNVCYDYVFNIKERTDDNLVKGGDNLYTVDPFLTNEIKLFEWLKEDDI